MHESLTTSREGLAFSFHLREVLLNAVLHRDYSNPSGYVAVAVFDDRIEVSSLGTLPRGVTAEELSGPHRSVTRNPLIAETFHRTGAVEIWGRGTNRVIEACLQHGLEAPVFQERNGFVSVTFRAQIVEPGQVTPQVVAVRRAAQDGPVTRSAAKLFQAFSGRYPLTFANLYRREVDDRTRRAVQRANPQSPEREGRLLADLLGSTDLRDHLGEFSKEEQLQTFEAVESRKSYPPLSQLIAEANQGHGPYAELLRQLRKDNPSLWQP